MPEHAAVTGHEVLCDQYLARVYRLIARRFHFHDWERSIRRKLQMTESIHEKMSDRHANLRMEVLEWIIIILIALELVIPFAQVFPPK